ncbi:S24 family peptidase [Aliivibrio salmonicida]|uniref:S24 family peptidase n=1 Tax=Aliivibrio salmonicida TaxID=40269 RepID=UPI00406C2E9A
MLNTSMHPTIPINSAVIVNRESKYNEDGIYAFEHNKSVMVRRIQRKKNDILISCDNDKYKSFTVLPEILSDFTFIGRVVGVMKNV